MRHSKFYTSVKSGVTMSFKGWLQLISQKEFGRELCMSAPSLWEPVKERFEEYRSSGILVPWKEVSEEFIHIA